VLIIWRFTDGKPGHEKQTLGLAHALLRQSPGECIDIAVPARRVSFVQWLSGRFPAGVGLPAPQYLLAAGHATHFALLAARRVYGGRAVVMMQPSLPLALFDLCVISAHDAPPVRENVIRIRGVLNDVRTSSTHLPEQGLILVGGESNHYRWEEGPVIAAIVEIARAHPKIHWQLTTSRRTPASFLLALPQLLPINLSVIHYKTCRVGWLEQALSQASQVWVTEDSVSMLYEALTAGAGVGLLRLPKLRDTRVSRGVQHLLVDGWVKPYEPSKVGELLFPPPGEFNEANRVANLILSRDEQYAAI